MFHPLRALDSSSFVFEVQDGVNEVLLLERANAVLPAKTGEDGAVVECGLAVKIEFGGPPCGGAIFEFSKE